MNIEKHLPWYIALLNHRPRGVKFDRLVQEFALTSEEEEWESVRWYENEKLGISVSIHKGKIEAIQFLSPEHPFSMTEDWNLPIGLNFSMKREDVHKSLGKPDHVTSGRTFTAEYSHAGIERYYTKKCTIAITYSVKTETISVLGFEFGKKFAQLD